MRKRGPINPHTRLDYLVASLTAAVLNASGAKKSGGGQFALTDTLLKWGEPAEEEATLQDVFAMLLNSRKS